MARSAAWVGASKHIAPSRQKVHAVVECQVKTIQDRQLNVAVEFCDGF